MLQVLPGHKPIGRVEAGKQAGLMLLNLIHLQVLKPVFQGKQPSIPPQIGITLPGDIAKKLPLTTQLKLKTSRTFQ